MLVSVIVFVFCSLAAAPRLLAGYLFGRGVETVEEVGRRDTKDQGCERLLVIMQSGLVPYFLRVLDRTGR